MWQGKRMTAILVVMAVLSVLLIAQGMIFAQEGTSDRTAGNLGQTFLDKLAGSLGISQSQLQQAAEKAARDTLKEGVSKGYLTQEQADKLQQITKEQPWALLGKPNHGRGDLGLANLAGCVAQALGMTSQELRQQLQQGKTLDQLLAEKNLSKEQLKTKIVEQASQKLNQAVQKGQITRERADQQLQRLQQLDPGKLLMRFQARPPKPQHPGFKKSSMQSQGA